MFQVSCFFLLYAQHVESIEWNTDQKEMLLEQTQQCWKNLGDSYHEDKGEKKGRTEVLYI